MTKSREEFTRLLAERLDEALGEDLHPLFLARLATELTEGDLSDGSMSAMTTGEARRARAALKDSMDDAKPAAA